jgi:hypothetical protein
MTREMRSTFIDADEARMMAAMRRYRGDDTAREAGNVYSRTNGERIAALAERNALRPPPPPPPPPRPARKGLEPKTSARAVAVPRVGRPAPVHHAPVEFIPRVGRLPERAAAAAMPAGFGVSGRDRPDYAAYEPAPLAPYRAPAESRDEAKERLQDRIAYGAGGEPPSRDAAARAAGGNGEPAPRISEAAQLAAMAGAISREIDERRAFLGEMGALGKREQYEPQIRAEISERHSELKRLQALLAAMPD